MQTKENIKKDGDNRLKIIDNGVVTKAQVTEDELVLYIYSQILEFAEILDPTIQKDNAEARAAWVAWVAMTKGATKDAVQEGTKIINEWVVTHYTPETLRDQFKTSSPTVFRIMDEELDRCNKPIEALNNSFDESNLTVKLAKWLVLRDALRDEVNRRKREKQTDQRKPQLKSLATVDGFLRGPADPINQHMFGAFTPGAMKKHADAKGDVNNLEARGMTGIKDYTALYIVESNKDLYGVIGYKQDVGENLWELLQKHSALTLQAHIALFARAYAETDAKPGEFITLRILDFCDDLQFTRKRGSHDRQTKQRVVSILECLTQAQMKIMYAPPEGRSYLHTGPIWQRGITQETASQPGGKLQWEPETFSYAPGQYFAFNEWRNYTRNVALIGEGLLKLNANNDKWAIHCGAYLALLSRMNGYRKQTLSVKTLLEKTGLFAAYAKFRKTSEMEQKLIRALETLEEVGVIQKWDWVKMEDGENLSQKLATETLLNRQIQIQYPVALQRNEKRIADGVAKKQKNNQKKAQSSIGK